MAAFALLAFALAAAQPARLPIDALRDGPAPPPFQRARPLQPFQSYLMPGDYPAAALSARAEGRVAFELAALPDGRVYFCRVMQSSGSAALDAATCRILRARVRYVPARDEAGRAVVDDMFGVIEWRLPRR
jgi:protein TonB